MRPIETFCAEKKDIWIWLDRFGEAKINYDPSTPHRHDFYEILFFEKGDGIHLVDFVEFPIKSNSCYFLFPHQVHSFKHFSKPKGCVIRCYEEGLFSTQLNALILSLSFAAKSPTIFEDDPQKFADVMQLLNPLQHLLQKYPDTTNHIILHLFQSFLLYLLEISGISQDFAKHSKNTNLIVKFLQLVENNFFTAHTVKEYAEELLTTERKISSATQHYLGLNPLQVIHNRILLEAKRLMLYENRSQKEIAFKLGFDSSDKYSHFIKNKTGLAPTEIKKEIGKIHKI